MKYTEYGLMITIDELQKMLDLAKNRAEHDNMEGCIYIKGGERPKITQYCSYAECNAINYTSGVR